MKARYFMAAVALGGAAAVLVAIEPAVLGGPLSARRGTWLSTFIQQGPIVCAWAAAACVAAGLGWLRWLAWIRPPSIARGSFTEIATRGIPLAGAHAVAGFRLVFSAGLLVVLSAHHIDDRALLQTITRAAIVLFAIGLLTRAALIVATIGIWMWMLVWTEQFGTHPVSTLLVALPCLWPARWADAWSIDAWRTAHAPQAPSIRYGYALWMPAFVVGVALFAAAAAKLVTPEWIVNGTVKFAFVADYHRASVPWGLWIASHPAAAVAASAGAIAIEALAITIAFSRSWVYRLIVGAIVASLFAGFYLLQGELWWGWWVLMTAYLPWQMLDRRATEAERASQRLSRVQWAAIAALVALQVMASVGRLEIRPAISAYDMYSTTFDSTTAFDRANPMLVYRFEAETPAGQWIDVTDCFARPASPEDAATWKSDLAALRGALVTCRQALPTGLRRLRLVESLRVFGWRTGVFSWKYRDRERWTVPI